MKTYIADIIPKIQRFSQKLDNVTLLTNQHWVVINEITSSKTVYIFRPNGELLIVTNGKVSKAKWEYLGNRSILIDNNNESYLFKHGFFDENVLALKIDSKDEYAFLVNENKYEGEINSIQKAIDFLQGKYLSSTLKKNIEISSGISIKKEAIESEIKEITPRSNDIIRINDKEEEHERDSRQITIFVIILVLIAFIMVLMVQSKN